MKLVESFVAVLISVLILQGCGKNESKVESEKTPKTENNTTNVEATINLPTMQCGTCKKNIETAVKKVDGISECRVDKNAKVRHVNFDNSKTDVSKIESAVTAAGYNANDKQADPEAYNNLDDCCKLPKDRKEKDSHDMH